VKPRRVLALTLVALVAALAWVGVRGYLARQHLVAARAEVAPLQQAFASRDRAGVPERLARVRTEAAAARDLTSDPVWTALSHVPWAGRTLRTSGGVARAVDDLATEALPELQRVAETLTYADLRPAGDRIGLEPLAAAREPLVRVRDSVTATEERVRRLPDSFVLGAVGDAREDLLDQLAGLRGTTSAAALAAEVGPPMLGAGGTRRYFVAILNNAEMRGSGGLLGAYAILEASRGKLTLTRLGTNADLRNTTPKPAVTLDADYVARYRRFSSDSFWLNANMSPHFPYASASWTALWAATHGGERLDGTIAIDPVALAEILRVTGPATLPDGSSVDAGNVVRLTESEAYVRFAKDNRARDVFLQQVAVASYRQMVSGAGEPGALFSALARAAGTRHLQVASVHAAEQDALAAFPVAGVLPSGPAPYLEVVTQNAGGNKLDYHVERTVTYTRVDPATVRVEVRLRNAAPAGLPPYVTSRLDLRGGRAPVAGQQHEYVSVYATAGAGLREATVDGRPAAMESEVERGRPVYSTFVDLDPGRELVLTLVLDDPTPGTPFVRQPPLVRPDVLVVRP
jgi:hypothetical protein